MSPSRALHLLLVAGCLLLSACGAGGTGAVTTVVAAAAPAITTQPTAQTTILGQSATFSVVASGSPAPTYQWLKNGSAIAGATAASYHTPATTKADLNAIFMVVVSNDSGTVASSGASLALQWPPQITTQPADLEVSVGDVPAFTVVADASPSATFQWLKNGQTIAGATSATLTAAGAVLADSGTTYMAVASNSVGSQSSHSATLTVHPLPTPVAITAQPLSSAVLEGRPTWFTVTATGTAPLNYQWYKNGTAIAGATTDTLAFTAAQLTDAGSYTVVVDNLAKSPQTSTAATLTVTQAPVAPAITSHTLDLTLTEGNSASFKVVATGTGPLSYQWQRNQTDLPGASADTYALAAVAMADNGAQFRCRVGNVAGTVYSPASTLTVLPASKPPVITSFQASPAVIAIGDSTTLAWAVTAARTLNLDNGVGDVTGSSSRTVTPTQAGTMTFTLTAANAAGSSSATAQVTVNPGPSFPLSVTLAPGITGSPAAGKTSYLQGTSVPYSYSLGPGLVNLQVSIDGANVNPAGSILMTGAHNLVATAQAQILTISPSAGSGGSISPASPVLVPFGQNATFTVTPDAGCNIADVQVDGVSVGAAGQYVFQNVTANHTISASFVQSFALTVNLGPGVTGSPSSGNYPAGPVPYAFTTLPGYMALSVTEDADPTPLPASGFLQLDGPHSLNVSAQLMSLAIVTAVTGNGSIAPGGTVLVPYGEIPVFAFLPDPGWVLSQVQLDGVVVAAPNNSFSFPGPVVAGHTLQATFTPKS